MQIKTTVLISGICLAAPGFAAEDCASLEKLFHQAIDAGQIEQAEAQLQKIPAACPQSVARDDELYFTDTLAAQANDLAEKQQLDAAEKLLKKAKLDSWTVSAARGYIASLRPSGQRNWQEIASHYGHAVELLTDPDNPKLQEMPDLKQRQETMLKLAADAQMIYGKSDATIQRDGSPQGVFKAIFRGVQANAIPYPVHFDKGKSSLSADGKKSADALAGFIKKSPHIQSVTLTGHSDPKGSPAANQRISQERADAVASYMKAQGVAIPIKAIGKGDKEPPETAFDNLSEAEKFSRWRRVELSFQ
jgi:outer membrane protein OmpA-like peptidoglycan-associated protein